MTHSFSQRSFGCLVLLLLSGAIVPIREARGDLRIGDICRVKGQEENTLQGYGLVVGLKGTGDGDTPTLRALAKTLELMNGAQISKNARGQVQLDELKNAKNVAAVFVSVTVPGEGIREGSQLNCSVNALGAKSLEGGHLLLTPLRSPAPGSTKIYGFAQGPVSVDTSGPPTSARIQFGCRMETDISNEFMQDGKITLVVDRGHASFQTTQDIEDLLNNEKDFIDTESQTNVAKARDQLNIDVSVPKKYVLNPVQFISSVMSLRLAPPDSDARVVIREREGVIIIDDNVEIGPVAVTHRNLTIQTGGLQPINQFVPLDSTSDTSTTKLQALVNALNAVKVPTSDIIEIIKVLDRSGDLYGRLILE